MGSQAPFLKAGQEGPRKDPGNQGGESSGQLVRPMAPMQFIPLGDTRLQEERCIPGQVGKQGEAEEGRRKDAGEESNDLDD